VLLVADSLRYDAVFGGHEHLLPYAVSHGINFAQARSAGCWTLPATATLFTGLLPHAHGATSQSRAIRAQVPTLAERMSALGYTPYMVSANIATTEIFGALLKTAGDKEEAFFPLTTSAPSRLK
jgi:arylsulfatase A-like enzyme